MAKKGKNLVGSGTNFHPVSPITMRNWFRAMGPAAIKTLERLLECGDPQTELNAAKVVMERGYGKVPIVDPDKPNSTTPRDMVIRWAGLAEIPVDSMPESSVTKLTKVAEEILSDAKDLEVIDPDTDMTEKEKIDLEMALKRYE
jgi:hypothetical protein